MSSLHEGRLAEFIGPSHDGVEMGDRGLLLALSGHGAHVQWRTGALQGQVTLEDQVDLAPAAKHTVVALRDELDDSLEVGVPMGRTALSERYVADGARGVLAFLASTGELSTLSSIADEALVFVAGLVREHPSIQTVAAHLDESERNELVLTASQQLLREAFTGQSAELDDNLDLG
jgi:hypothetical protein